MADVTLPGSYVSVGDFSQTYTGIDSASLKAGELARAIRRASGLINDYCDQILYATADQETLSEGAYPVGGWGVDPTDGRLLLFPKNFPIRNILALSYRYRRSDTPTSITLTDLILQERFVRVDGYWVNLRHRTPSLQIDITYTNGFFMALLASAVSTGATTATFKPQQNQTLLQGALAGSQVEFQDGTPEVATILSVSGNVVTFTAPLTANHAIDVMVAEMDASAIQQATLLLAEYLIKTKGVGVVSLKDEGIQAQRSGPETDLLTQARDLVRKYKVVNV